MTLLLLTLISVFPHQYEITCEDRSIEIESERIELQDYVALKTIVEVLNVNYVLNNATQRLYLTGGGHKLVLMANINTIVYDGVYQNVPFAPLYIPQGIYFPVHAITSILGKSFEKLIFIKEIKEAPLIDKISIVARGDSSVVIFNWKNPIDFDVQFSPQKVVIEIDGRYKHKISSQATSVTSVILSPYDTYTKIEFDIKNINSFLERPNEVVFYNKITEEVRLIVIDPGHGGVDPGAVGKKGLYEKDANLGIALELKKLIKDSLNVDVLLTREKDIYLSLKERTNIANRNSADLFVSIHCNAAAKNKSQSRGFETFFLSEAKTDEARAAAALENAALKFDGIEPTEEISFILHDLAQSVYLEESNSFAEHIQASAEKSLSIPSRGINQAGFYVLHGAFMPAVLVECAFISHPDEESLLKQKQFRKKVAYSIFHGIKTYIKEYERRLNN
jgi:N-acetylmuramoyl-L-alanine amidase